MHKTHRYNEFGMPIIHTKEVFDSGISKSLDGLNPGEKSKIILDAFSVIKRERLGKVVREINVEGGVLKLWKGKEGYTIEYKNRRMGIGHWHEELESLPWEQASKKMLEYF
jgi:hypothetical protein